MTTLQDLQHQDQLLLQGQQLQHQGELQDQGQGQLHDRLLEIDNAPQKYV